MFLPQLLAHFEEKFVVLGSSKIGHAHRRAIASATGCTAGDDWNFSHPAFINQQAFIGEAVDGINEVIKAATENAISSL